MWRRGILSRKREYHQRDEPEPRNCKETFQNAALFLSEFHKNVKCNNLILLKPKSFVNITSKCLKVTVLKLPREVTETEVTFQMFSPSLQVLPIQTDVT